MLSIEIMMKHKLPRLAAQDVTMKEKIYGWYPSMKDIYRKKAYNTTYDQELLYKHAQSAYTGHPGVEEFQPPTPIRIQLSPRPPPKSAASSRSPTRSIARSAQPSRVAAATQTTPLPVSRQSERVKSAPPSSCARSIHSQSVDGVSTSGKLWKMSVPATSLSPMPPQRPESTSEAETEAWLRQLKQEILAEADQQKKVERVRSAAVHRPRTTPPARQIKSAGSKRTVPSQSQVQRPKNPIPPTPSTSEVEGDAHETLDYDTELKKHGWRFELHGDPFGLKKPCISQRPKFFQRLSVNGLQPDPPKVHMESSETFFYNTIPRKPATFVIGQDWTSEVIHAKRMELQKRDGLKYRWKNFSFVY